MSRGQKNFCRSRKQKAILIIGAYILLLLVACICFRGNNKIKLEMTYYFSQIITSVFVVSGVVIAVWQYYLSKKN